MEKTMEILAAAFLLLGMVRTQEVATPSSLLGPRNFNHHAYEAKQYLRKISNPIPTRKGPVLFPDAAAPPPRTPLIVTSRPLIESIARSDLNMNLTSNAISDQSQINTVTFKPNYFGMIAGYKPLQSLESNSLANGIGYTLSPTIGSNIVDHDYSYDPIPYTDIVKKSIRSNLGADNRYSEYEEKNVLPPTYNALSQRGQQKLFNTQTYPAYDYQAKNQQQQYGNNAIPDEGNNSENAQAKSYAFSYAVKDQKTGDDFSHSQRSSGSATNGEYRVRLPDGRVQTVSYTADENGYKADVKYDVDSTGNSVEYNVEHSTQNANNHYDYNQYNNNAQKYNIGNNIFYSDYQSPTKGELYPDVSKEYYNDYSSEYGIKNYNPHESKFATLVQEKKSDTFNNLNFNAPSHFNQDYITSTAKPNYLELRDVLTKALPNVQPTFNSYPKLYETTTENVVLIGGRNRFPSPTAPSSTPEFNSFTASSPRSYLVSTIASLRDRVGSKPVLSDSFINRINKYLSFK